MLVLFCFLMIGYWYLVIVYADINQDWLISYVCMQITILNKLQHQVPK